MQKPTAEIYYEKMINKLKWNVKWQQVKAKMLNFRTKFVQVKTWLEGTGQGVDSGTIEGFYFMINLSNSTQILSTRHQHF